MAIQLTYNTFGGYMKSDIMKRTKYTATYKGATATFYTYSFTVPFEPTQNPAYAGITFHDIHGNTYNAADNIIAAKLDIGAFYSDATKSRSPLEIYLPLSDIGATRRPDFSTLPSNNWSDWALENDPFDPFDYTPLLNGTDGYMPNDPLKPQGQNLMPFPVIAYFQTYDTVQLHSINTMINSTPDTPIDMYLLKMNTPLFISNTSSPQFLNRIILYGKPFLNRIE